MSKETRRGRRVNRRDMLALLGAAGAGLLARPAMAQSGEAPSGTAAMSCIATPRQTEGPYFVDERLQRADIRSDPGDGAIKEGVPLALMLSVSAVGSGGCKPIAGAVVDVWHCDAEGVYSGVRDRRSNTTGKKFLRGYQVTDERGLVRFTTIYPGWYPGRAVHIHFKVRTAPGSDRGHELTSQLYFDDAITDRVFSRPPYQLSAGRRTRNDQDGLFRHGGRQLILPLTTDGPGYAGSFAIGLQMA